jgi:hypothetical protein
MIFIDFSPMWVNYALLQLKSKAEKDLVALWRARAIVARLSIPVLICTKKTENHITENTYGIFCEDLLGLCKLKAIFTKAARL